MQPELLLDTRAELGEGPVWDSRTGRLHWVDIHAGDLHTFDPQTGADTHLHFDEFLGCLALACNGRLVLALKSGFARLDPATGKLEHLLDPEPGLPGNRFNDGKCDPAGRFLAGSMDDAEQEASGSLYSLSPDGACQRLLSGLRISNGLDWSPDGRTFYFIDTPTRLVMAYDYDLTCGAIAHPRPAVSIPAGLGWPDGMTCDSLGRLWIALWGGAALTCWDPASSRLLETVRFPALNVTCPVFGGPDLADLYVTSARKGMSAAQLAEYPFSGGLFRVRTGASGLPTGCFGS